MLLSELYIRNFRNFHKIKIQFKDQNSVILGENGSGKTNLFRAIRHVIDKRYLNRPKEDDFTISLESTKKGHWIIIQAKFTGVTKELGSTATRLKPDENGVAWINFFYRPGVDVREKLVELSEIIKKDPEQKKEMEKYLESIDIRTDYELVRTVGEIPDYAEDNNYKDLVGDIENMDFTNLKDFKDTAKTGDFSIDCIRYLNVIYVPAGRNPFEEMIKDNGLVYKLISTISKDVKKENYTKVEETVKRLNTEIDNIDEYKDVAQVITDIYEQTIGTSNARNASIRSIIPEDFKHFTRYLGISFNEDDTVFDIASRSLGEQSLLYLVLRLVNDKASQKQKYTLILLEEPEVHLHTHLQRTLFRKSQDKKDFGNQLILSTHSSYISDSSKISKMILLENRSNDSQVFYPSNLMDKKDMIVTERYLDANRTPLLFARSVMLVEGDAEAIILPWLFEQHYSSALDEHCVSLIKMDSTFFTPVASMFNKDRIRRYCYIITDIDKDYTSDNSKAEAEKNGRERKEKLDVLQDSNEYISVFYAENTFEIQFYLDNIDILIKMIENDLIYLQKSKQEEIVNGLKSSDKKPEIIMKCVNHVKKGWLAIKLVNYCTENELIPVLPKYIKSAFDEVIENNACRYSC